MKAQNNDIKEIIILFTKGELQTAETKCLSILAEVCAETRSIEAGEERDLFTILAMLLFLKGSVYGAMSWAGTCRDSGREDVLTNFLIRLGTKTFNDFFIKQRGKELPIFDLELVYTTEDEIFVDREKENKSPSAPEESLSLFWLGFVGGDWETVKSEYKNIDDEFIHEYIRHVDDVMLFNKQIEVKMEDKVLEIGSGRGKIAYLLYKKGLRGGVTLLEINGEELRRSREYLDEFCEGHAYNFVEGDAQNIGEMFRPKSFDVIVAADLVEHMYNSEFLTMLKGVYSILKDDGRFYIQTPNGLRYFGVLEKDAEGLVNRDEFNGAHYPHVSEKSVGYLKQTLLFNGFDVRVLARGRLLIKARKSRGVINVSN